MTKLTTSRELLGLGLLSRLDYELSETLLELAGESATGAAPAVALGIALASNAVQRGHVCVDLSRPDLRKADGEDAEGLDSIRLPDLDAWLAALAQSKLVTVGTAAAEPERPLVLAGGRRLYLARYHRYETRLAEALVARAGLRFEELDGARVRAGLDAFFPSSKRGVEQQRRACVVALSGGLSVISGGPGTGKTFTVAKVLSLLQDQALARGAAPARIQLLAPTGKAAQRLGEAIEKNLTDVPEALRPHIPRQASTIHRALGYQPATPTRFRHHRTNPLPADVVVVDEASMVDLALMAKLVDAVHPQARLVLLGDKDQLASVEAGAILGEIYARNPGDGFSRAMVERVKQLTGDELPVSSTLPDPGLQDSMMHLTFVHRYEGGSPIDRLAREVTVGEADRALSMLEVLPRGEPHRAAGDEDVFVRLYPVEPGDSVGSLFGALVDAHFAGLRSGTIQERLGRLAKFRFLCAHRRGKLGVEGINRFVSERLGARGEWFDGRPILVTANDYSLELFNGDVGILAEDHEASASETEPRPLAAFFPDSGSKALRRFAPGQLPPHETAFAMSVHKAQGSELDEVALVLPDSVSPILTRELVYTGITRAKKRVTIFASGEVLKQGISARVLRASGLGQRLWG